MATNTSVCAICDLRHVTSQSIQWCPECEEALCSDCSEHHSLSKATRGHKTIPIEQYQSLPTFVTDIQQFCIYHNEKYQQYCMKHECPICYKCIKEHGKCIEVIPLEDVISEVKHSELARDLEQSLGDVLENIQQIQEDRENNVRSIQTQKMNITMEIDSMKTRIIQHLDKLKESIIKELEQVYDNHSCRIQSIISSLKSQEQEIKHCSTEFENITKFASDLQSFLGMKEIQSKVTDNEKRLRSIIENKSLENVEIHLAIDDKIQAILTSAARFGSIIIKESPSACTNTASKKTRQAQIAASNIMQSINTISVAFKQEIKTACRRPRGCTMTQTGLFIFVDYAADEKLVAINKHGKTEYSIKFSTPYSAFDVELINDNTVAVTTGQSYKFRQLAGVCIVDLTKRKVIKFIDLPAESYGIKHDGTSLICCVKDKNLHLISCTDYCITEIPNTVLIELSYVTTHTYKIFYTNFKESKVFCCLFDGTPLWEFHDILVLQKPRGITVDDKGNIFVVGNKSRNVLIISPDGKKYKEILNTENGIFEPWAIFFDNIGNQLLVTNHTSFANLYTVSYS